MLIGWRALVCGNNAGVSGNRARRPGSEASAYLAPLERTATGSQRSGWSE